MASFTKSNRKGITFYFSFIVIFLASLLLYLPSLKFYFFQDDWFILNWAKTGSILSFLSFRKDIIYWRPLSMPIFFATLNKLFGLNYIAFHIFAFFIFLLLLIMIYKLLNYLFEDFRISLILTFLYGIWPINYISLSWLAATQYIIAPIFMTASFLSFVKYVRTRRIIFLALNYTTFVGALVSHETALVLPLLFVIWVVIYKEKIKIRVVSPMLAVSFFYILLRFFVIPLPARGSYEMQMNKMVFLNFFWYFLWSFNFPESFKSMIDPRVIEQSILVLKQFWWISLSCLAIIFLFMFMLIRSLKSNLRHYVFGFSWFSIMLLPVIFVTNHTYPIYLSFAGIGLLFMIGMSLKESKYVFTFAFIICWTISAVANFQFTRSTHWAENEQSISKTYVQFTKSIVRNPLTNSTFVFLPAHKNSKQKSDLEQAEDQETLKLSLSDQNAMQVIYGNSTIKSFYPRNSLEVPNTTGSVYYLLKR